MNVRIFSKLNSRKVVKLVLGLAIIVFLVLVILGWGGIGPFKSSKSIQTEVQKSEWQAVFLTNGQVYFGHLAKEDSQYPELEEIYYLQMGQSLQAEKEETEAAPAGLNLIKLGDELHGPQDKMIINRDHILFWENLKDDSRVVDAIKDYHP